MKKILLSFIISAIILSCGNNIFAASYSFNFSGPSEASKGQTVTLTITATGLTGKVNLSSTNATLSSSSVWVEKNSVNITAKITGFPAKITASPSELTDNEYNIVSLGSKTVTINEKKTSNSGGSTSSGSSSSGSSSGGSSSNKPSTGGSSSSGSSSGSSSSTSKPNTKPSGGTSSTQSPDQTYVPSENNLENGVKSSNNYLQSITLSAGNLSPEFYRETFEYNVENLDESINEIEISAVAEDERASISGLGKISLNEGENRITLAVTAENESVREYIIVVNRKQTLQESDLRLQTLEISKINRNGEFSILDIPFDKETFEYSLDVEEDIEDLDVNPSVEKEGIIVEVTGDKNLKEGENIVNIALMSQADENMQTNYIIKVNRQSKIATSAEIVKMDETWKIVTICILIVLLVGEIILYAYLKKKGKIK